MHDRTIQEDINAVLAQLDQPASTALTPLPEEPGEHEEDRQAQETLHIYPIADEQGTIKGYYLSSETLAEEQEAAPVVADAPIIAGTPTSQVATAPAVLPPRSPITTPGQRIVIVCSLLVFCLVVGSELSLAFYSLFFAPVSITITPQQKSYTTTLMLQLVTGMPTSLTQVQARRLAPLTITQKSSTQATGSYHQDPTYAIGYVTFYNGQFSQITIPAGTQLTTQEGKAIVTTQSATVPGVDQSATPPALGEATIPARASAMGASGNISAYAVNQACCATSVLAKNTQAFTGGQDEIHYTIVKQSNIDTQIAPLHQALTQSMTTTLQSQVKRGETLLPTACSPQFTPDHKAGDAARSVSVTATETCSGLVYDQATLYSTVFSYINSHAPGAHYIFSTVPIAHILTTVLTPTPIITLSVMSTFVYQFSTSEIAAIQQRLAGLPMQHVYQVLHDLPGVAAVRIEGVSAKANLPANPGRLRIHVLNA